jgi:mRNA interferase HigB
VRIIAWRNLAAFARDHPRASAALHRWARATYGGEWRSTADVVAEFSTAKTVSRDRIRFEIDGGNFRLIVAYNFKRQIAFVKFVGTHAQYDQVDAATVEMF